MSKVFEVRREQYHYCPRLDDHNSDELKYKNYFLLYAKTSLVTPEQVHKKLKFLSKTNRYNLSLL